MAAETKTSDRDMDHGEPRSRQAEEERQFAEEQRITAEEVRKHAEGTRAEEQRHILTEILTTLRLQASGR